MADILGVDIGGVIIGGRKSDGSADTSFFGENFLETPALPKSFEALKSLNDNRFKNRIFLISKCGPSVEEKTKAWLEHHQFYEKTGISPQHLKFCRERNEKAGLCEDLSITHFVDDRLEVLGYLINVDHLYLFRPDPEEVEQFKEHLEKVKRIDNWKELLPILTSE